MYVRKFEAAHQRPETGNINYELVVALHFIPIASPSGSRQKP